MSRYKRFQRLLKQQWRSVVVAAVLVVVPLSLFTIRLASHSRGILPEEQRYLAQSDTVREVFQSPGFMPHRIAMYALQKVGIHHIIYYRAISVVIGLVAVWGFYYILTRWYTRRVALIGAALLSGSSLLLHTVRVALPDVLLLCILMTIAIGLWLQRTKKRLLALYVFVSVLALTVYIPGLIWVAVAALIWQGKRLARVIARQKTLHRCGLILTPVLLLAPAVASLGLHPLEALTVVGLPAHAIGVRELLSHAQDTLVGIAWRHKGSSSNWTPNTPVFDIITTAMIVLGFYSLRFEQKLRRSRIQLGILALTLSLVLTMGPVTMVAILPAFYLLAAGGVAFMLQQWFTVFPRNPFARVVAVICICGAVLGITIYQTYRYFTVWPNHPDVRVVLTDEYLVK